MRNLPSSAPSSFAIRDFRFRMHQVMHIVIATWMVCGLLSVAPALCDAVPDIDGNPIVSTTLGQIQGSVMNSRLDRRFYAFRGIRYGKAPVGELRFKAPEPVDPWTTVFDATDDGPMCVQYRDDDYSDVSEDCLRLNVYSHSISEIHKNATADRKPVLVYIHPGGFYGVSGQSKNFAGPQNLMDRDIVLVTLNYRLGSLGMMAAGTKEYPGNAALKDQVLVLKWIKDHIGQFGGNPNMVTIMGYSAGGMSVTLHMVSPMSKGLFHRAIVMSGSATSQWELPTHQIQLIEREARLVNCPTDSVDSMVACMNTRNATDFGNSLIKMFEFGEGNPILVWTPVVEPDLGQERFLTDNPTRLFRLGRFHRVPVMAGITELEFAGPAISIMEQPTLRFEMDTKFNEIAPICFLYERSTNRSEVISQQLRRTFLNGPLLSNRSIGLEQLFADGVIGFGMHRFVRLASLYTRVFYYKNTYVGRYSHLYYPNDKPLGTVHHDDLLYLFVAPAVAPMFKVADPENLQVEKMTRMWSNFATKGDPNNRTDTLLATVRWRPMLTARLNYLNIAEQLEMRDRLFVERYEKWAALFPLTPMRRGKDDPQPGELENLPDYE